MYKILLVEDENSIAEMVQLNLEMEGYSVKWIAHGKEAIEEKSVVNQYQLVILDVMLPEISGFDICRAYREVSKVPILFLSAKGTSTDRIMGLKLGANDYLPKPFDLEELLLRVRNLLPNLASEEELLKEFTIGEITVSFLEHLVIDEKTKQHFDVSKREMELLKFFILHKNTVISRDTILQNLWETDMLPTGRTIDNYILNFRKIFEKDPKNPNFFLSIRGIGYKFVSSD